METGKSAGWIVNVSGCRRISGFLSILPKKAPFDDGVKFSTLKS
jgi:hypothetical protein